AFCVPAFSVARATMSANTSSEGLNSGKATHPKQQRPLRVAGLLTHEAPCCAPADHSSSAASHGVGNIASLGRLGENLALRRVEVLSVVAGDAGRDDTPCLADPARARLAAQALRLRPKQRAPARPSRALALTARSHWTPRGDCAPVRSRRGASTRRDPRWASPGTRPAPRAPTWRPSIASCSRSP